MKKKSISIIVASMIVFAGVAHGAVAKWSQLPSMDLGNGYSFSSESQVVSVANFASQVADDFEYQNNSPVTAITWWGSYWDTVYNGTVYAPYRHSDGWGDPDAGPPDIVTGFNITFYQDVKAGSAFPPWSHPGAQSGRTYNINIADINVQEYGAINRPASTQTVFQYDVVLEIPLTLTAGNIYWISIQAVDDNGEFIQWGWQESDDHWNDNAVQTFPGNPFLWDMLPGEDMAFELNAVPVPTSLLLMASGLLGFVCIRRKS